MLAKFIETLYSKVFVNIVVEGAKTTVYLELCSGDAKQELINNAHATFQTEKVNAEMLEFIDSYVRETPYFYVSVLDTSLEQGALPTCEKNRLGYYRDVSASECKCHHDKWTYFTSKSDLYAIEKRYKKTGVDFIFSPFTLLAHFFKDKLSADLAMFILVQVESISIAVFNRGELLYADHLDIQKHVEDDVLSSGDLDDDMELDLGYGIDLEGIDVDSEDMNIIDDFADIEDLDSIEDIDEFSENKDIEEELYEATQESTTQGEDDDNFNGDYQRFSLIQSSLGHYYKDLKYESSFIENVYIADGMGVSSDLKKYLEEEMFLNVYVRRVDLGMEVCELAKMELKA